MALNTIAIALDDFFAATASTTTKSPMTPASIVFDLVFVFLIFLSPPFRFRGAFALTVHSALSLHALKCTSNSLLTDFTVYMVAVNVWFVIVDFLIVDGPPETNPMLQWDGKPQVDTWPLREKAGWVCGLFTNCRGIGWKWQGKDIVEVQHRTRSGFVRHHILGCALCVAALFTLQANAPTKESLNAAPPFEAAIRSNICIAIIFCVLNLAYSGSSALAVGLGLSQPSEWPPLFGDVREAYSIRRVWGRFWHQAMRRRFQTGINPLLRTLGLPTHDHIATSAVRILLAFTICGLIHGLPLYFSSGGIEGNQFRYFLLQPVGIFLESFFGELYTDFDGMTPTSRKWIGRMWVLAWFGITNQLFVKGFFEAGLEPLWLYGKY